MIINFLAILNKKISCVLSLYCTSLCSFSKVGSSLGVQLATAIKDFQCIVKTFSITSQDINSSLSDAFNMFLRCLEEKRSILNIFSRDLSRQWKHVWRIFTCAQFFLIATFIAKKRCVTLGNDKFIK